MNQAFYTQPNKKHPAFILAIDANYFQLTQVLSSERGLVRAFGDPINHYPHELFLQEVQSHLVIREREYLDESTPLDAVADGGEIPKGNPNYQQILPYMIARQIQPDGSYLYFPYRRTKGVGESRLAGNGSVGYGGHVDLEDVMSTNSVIDLESTIILSMLREASEEFTIFDQDGDELILDDSSIIKFSDLFIQDKSNEVGELHVGVVMLLDVPAGFTLEANSEDHLKKLPAMTAEQMLADPEFKPENWTRIYLEYITHPATAATTGRLGIDHGGEQVGEVGEEILDGALRASSTTPADLSFATAVAQTNEQLRQAAETFGQPKEDFQQSTDGVNLAEKLRAIDSPVAQSLGAMLEVAGKMAEVRQMVDAKGKTEESIEPASRSVPASATFEPPAASEPFRGGTPGDSGSSYDSGSDSSSSPSD